MLVGVAFLPSLIPALWNIGILLHKQATHTKHSWGECMCKLLIRSHIHVLRMLFGLKCPCSKDLWKQDLLKINNSRKLWWAKELLQKVKKIEKGKSNLHLKTISVSLDHKYVLAIKSK